MLGPGMMYMSQGNRRYRAPTLVFPPDFPFAGQFPFGPGFPFHAEYRDYRRPRTIRDRNYRPCPAHGYLSPHHHGHRRWYECCHGQCRDRQALGEQRPAAPSLRASREQQRAAEAGQAAPAGPSRSDNAATNAAGNDNAAPAARDIGDILADLRRLARELEAELSKLGGDDDAGS